MFNSMVIIKGHNMYVTETHCSEDTATHTKCVVKAVVMWR